MARVFGTKGICLSFNLLHQNEIFNTDVVDAEFLEEISSDKDYHRSAFGWDLENGYTDKTQFRTYPLRSVSSKTDLGFKILFDLMGKTSEIECNYLRASRLLCTFQATGLNWKINILTFRLKGRLRSLWNRKSSWIRTPWNSINHKSKRENQNVCSTYQVNFISGENVIIPTKGNSNISKSTQNQTVNWSVWPISHTTLVGVSLLQCQVLNFASIPEWSWI